jgi:hypothetical protein
MQILLLLVLLLAPSMASAAYQNPIVIANERQANGLPKLIFQFTGNAGEPVVTRDFIVQPSSTATSVRNWVDATLNELDLMHTTAKLAAIEPGKTVPRLAPVVPPPTARMVWRREADWYAQTCTHGFAGLIATECGTLKTKIENTYQAGWILGE